VTHGSGHVADQDKYDDENQGQTMGDVHECIVVRRTREIHLGLVGSLQI